MNSEDRPSRPLPTWLDPRRGRGKHGPGGPPGHSATGRLALAVRLLCGLLSLAVLVGSGWGWYLARVAEASVSRTNAIPATGNSDVGGSDHAGKEMNLLLVGRDSRAGLTDEQRAELSAGDQQGLLDTDTMILVHIPADGSAASFVSLPRDMYVPIPGHGKAKLNSAYGTGYDATAGSDSDKDAGGARLMIQTISQVTGLQIDHFAEVNMLGFFNLSNIVGGVQVNLCAAVDDPYSGAHFPAGVQTISGADALRFVRQRHGLPRGDLDRVVRQQVYIAGLIRNVLSQKLLLDLGKQKQIVQQVGSSVTIDQGLDLFDLAAQMQSVQPGNITFQTVPGLTDATVDGAAVLQLPRQAVLTDFFASLTATPAAPAGPGAAPTTAIPSSDITVSVLNGSGVSGAASTAATALTAAGFRASSGGNAAKRAATTTITYPTGEKAQAAVLAAHVPGATLTADESMPAGTLQLVLGADFAGIGQAVTPATTGPAAGSYANNQRTAEDTSCIA
jgi:LCP family protein required for cell wall assembly